MAAVGASVALWPLISAMGPGSESGDIHVDLTKLAGDTEVLIDCAGVPVFVARRTPSQLDALKHPMPGSLPRDLSAKSNKPGETRDWHRTLRPDIMVFVGRCPHEGCMVRRDPYALLYAEGYTCPCCGARYDLAGRIVVGPARTRDLEIPLYGYAGDNDLIIRAATGKSCGWRPSSPLAGEGGSSRASSKPFRVIAELGERSCAHPRASSRS